MRKRLIRVLAVALTVCLCLGLMPAAMAASGQHYTWNPEEIIRMSMSYTGQYDVSLAASMNMPEGLADLAVRGRLNTEEEKKQMLRDLRFVCVLTETDNLEIFSGLPTAATELVSMFTMEIADLTASQMFYDFVDAAREGNALTLTYKLTEDMITRLVNTAYGSENQAAAMETLRKTVTIKTTEPVHVSSSLAGNTIRATSTVTIVNKDGNILYKDYLSILAAEGTGSLYLRSGSTYNISFDPTSASEDVELDQTSALPGTRVTFRLAPQNGRVVDRVYVTDKNGKVLELTGPVDGVYSFIMPAGDVVIHVTYLEDGNHVGYIVGFPDGLVHPEANMTRAQAVTIFFRLLTDEQRAEYWSQTNNYADVKSTDWFNNAVSTMSKMGIIEGYNGLFRPNDPITRAEFTKIAVCFFAGNDVSGEAMPFSDVEAGKWYFRYVSAAAQLGIVQGYNGLFRPTEEINRAEAVTIVNRIIGRRPDKDHLLPVAEMITWPDNMDTGAWYYADVQEATNSHSCKWITAGGKTVEAWTGKLEERDWVALEKTWSNAYSAPGGDVIG